MQSVQDTIQFAIFAEEMVTNTTVTIVANVVALITPEMTEPLLKESIRDLMQRFIKSDWRFSHMSRNSHAAGMEQVNLTATARVPEEENYALDRRRKEASREGLTIYSHTTDTSLASSQIDETHSKLRLAILRKAKQELVAINKALDETYRLGRVSFERLDPNEADPSRRRVLAAKTPYGSGFNNADDDVGNTVKVVMRATVELRRPEPSVAPC